MVVRRIVEERTLGPWSAGVICLEGLGRYEHGLVGDLGLIKLCTRLLGREATPADTAELLAPYGEWQGLASVYLLAGATLPRERTTLAGGVMSKGGPDRSGPVTHPGAAG